MDKDLKDIQRVEVTMVFPFETLKNETWQNLNAFSQAYPIGGQVVPRLNPGQVIQIMATRKEGLNIPGTYKLIVSLHRANLEVPGAVDRFNPKTPEKQLIVKRRPH